jgi:hypothetical protein
LERIEKNIRKIFTKAKVKFGLKKLKNTRFSTFSILLLEWKKYVKRFREKKII